MKSNEISQPQNSKHIATAPSLSRVGPIADVK